MKKIFVILYTLILTLNLSYADSKINIDGVYQGENLYIMNPFTSTGVGFCIYEVLVNNQISTDEINSSAFEIDLSVYGLNLGDKINIVIKHKDGCTPQVLNPEVIKPKSTFVIESIQLNKNENLSWITTGEVGSIPYIVEQYKWNKWVNIGTVEGKGTVKTNSYSFDVVFTSGNNQFRVKQLDYTKKPRYSQTVSYKNTISPITFKPGDGQKASKEIIFSTSTNYEIYDYYGSFITKGYGSKVDVSAFKAGTYFLNYDNKTETFDKK